MHKLKRAAVIFSLASFISLFALAVGANELLGTQNNPIIDENSAELLWQETEASSINSVNASAIQSSEELSETVYLPVIMRPHVPEMGFLPANCGETGEFQSPPATFSYGTQQLYGTVLVRGYVGQTLTFNWYLDGSLLFSTPMEVPESGVITRILSANCETGGVLPRGVYRVKVLNGNDLIIEGTATVQ